AIPYEAPEQGSIAISAGGADLSRADRHRPELGRLARGYRGGTMMTWPCPTSADRTSGPTGLLVHDWCTTGAPAARSLCCHSAGNGLRESSVSLLSYRDKCIRFGRRRAGLRGQAAPI